MNSAINATGIVYGAIAIIIGAIFLLFGIKMFRTVIATAGFLAASVGCFVLLTNVRQGQLWGPYGDLIMLGTCATAGIFGAILGLYMWMVALIAIGALAGLGLSLYLLSWRGGSIFSSWASASIARPIFLGTATLLGGFLAVIYERAVITVATSIVGSISLCSGVDVFAGTGFNVAMQEFIRNRTAPPPTTSTFILLGSLALLALLGIIIQSIQSRRGKREK